jgi:hypothetical protein
MLNRITDPLDTASTVLPALLPPDARAIVPAPQKKAMCQAKLTTGKEVYHAAIAEYTKKNIVGVSSSSVILRSKPIFTESEPKKKIFRY